MFRKLAHILGKSLLVIIIVIIGLGFLINHGLSGNRERDIPRDPAINLVFILGGMALAIWFVLKPRKNKERETNSIRGRNSLTENNSTQR